MREISHKSIEFQVRTELMHMEAEHGTAAHWRYKTDTAAMEQDHYHAQWMKGLARQHEKAESAEAFIKQLHRQVFHDHLVVFGNGGRILRLSENATVRDYLNISNIQISQGTVVKVNGKTAAIDQALRDGDSIEIVASGDLTENQAFEDGSESDLHGMGARYPFNEVPANLAPPDKSSHYDG